MASELISLFYPLGVWSFLYVILSWIIQCAIAIYGNFYASIPQLAKYEPDRFSAVHLNWVVSCFSISVYICLAFTLVMGITLKKYKNKPVTRLVDWILVLTALNSVCSVCNGLSIWGYGFRGWRSIHSLLIFDRPCCFAGSVWALRPQQQDQQQQVKWTQLSCVCNDFAECFTDQRSSECSQKIESRVEIFCCLLQMLQYLTTAFMIIEIILVVHAIAMVCKLNYENPINTYRLKTYNEYKTVKDSLRNQQMNQINDVQPPTNINPAARMSFDLNPRGGDDSISYSFPEPLNREVRSRSSLEYIIESSEQDEGSTSAHQELGAGLRSENGDDVATTVSRSSPLVGPPETQSVATANMPEMELVPNTRIDFSASGGSAELRNYFRHLSVGDVTATSEHLAEPLFRSSASSAKGLTRLRSIDGSFDTSQRLAANAFNCATETDSGMPESDRLSASMNDSSGNQRKTFRTRTSILELLKQGEHIPRLSMHSIPRNLNSNVCTKCAAHHKNHRHNEPGDIHSNKTNVTDTRDYKETKRREIESAMKTAVRKK